MDMHMPVMDGLEASSKIMSLNTGIPIVAMTANIMANDLEIYKLSGMHDCVGKPFTSQELWRTLMKYLTPINTPKPQRDAHIEADMEFQKSLQLLFVKSNQNKYNEIIEALNEGSIAIAHRLAHTLKSNSGQIGKNLLQKAAADIEYQLKDGTNNTTAEKLHSLKIELDTVLNDFAPLLNEENNIREEENMTLEDLPENTQNHLIKLEALLKGGNPECVDIAKDLKEIPVFRQLVQQIEDFEFDDAVTTLSILKKRFKWI